MDSEYRIFLSRAENELKLSMMVQRISDDRKMQIEVFGMKADTYYSAVIAHAYYSIFYGAKAYLLKKGFNTKSPEEHRKTFEGFGRLVDEGVDVELLMLYRRVMMKADILLHIFRSERSKRGTFTYKKIPQANQAPAQESIANAKTFFNAMYVLCG